MTISSPDNNRYRVHHHPKHVNTPLGHTLSLIEHPSSLVRFLILDCPTESTLSMYLEEFRNLHVSVVVRCCQPTYSTDSLFQRGIQVVDLPFKDGGIVSFPQFDTCDIQFTQYFQIIASFTHYSRMVACSGTS